MKIAVIGSNGRVGSLIVKEALNRGMDVTAIAKGENRSEAKNFISKDANLLTKEDLSSYDAVIDAVGGWTAETIGNITFVMKHLAEVLSSTDVRLFVVGGAGSLYVNGEETLTVDMGPEFPDSWKPLSSAHGEGLKTLRTSKDLNWTYVSPACNFVADGERTGEYQLGGEHLILNGKGESEISYADYAIAMVDIVLSGKYAKQRISVVSK